MHVQGGRNPRQNEQIPYKFRCGAVTSARKECTGVELALLTNINYALSTSVVHLRPALDNPRMARLNHGLQAALPPLASEYRDLQRGAAWLQDIDHILGPPDDHPIAGEQVSQQLRAYLDDLLNLPDASPRLDGFRHHLDKVSTSYWPGLFRCYDLEGLPRTNNDVERLFRDTQRRLLRTTGRRDKPVAPCSASVPGNCCPDRPPRWSAWTLCAESHPPSWPKNNNACANIGSSSDCVLDLLDESMLNSTSSASNGCLSQLRQQGDFCGIACPPLFAKRCFESYGILPVFVHVGPLDLLPTQISTSLRPLFPEASSAFKVTDPTV